MKFFAKPILSLCMVLLGLSACAHDANNPPVPMNLAGSKHIPRTAVADQTALEQLSLPALSANFVDRVIHDLPVEQHLARFAALDAAALDSALQSHAAQLSFWINLYNGHAQYLLKTDPTLYQGDRSAFFGKDQIHIAGYSVSMEDIEHGVLRRGATIWTLGHLRALWFRSEFIRRFAVDRVDFRIHFALNCGAASCPPVMVYQQATLEQQLDDNSQLYLASQLRYSVDDNKVKVPALLSWFSADFGSHEDKRAMLKRYGLIPDDVQPSLEYLKYDWRMHIANYAAYTPE